MQEGLANYYVLRWDSDEMKYIHVETWGIKRKEIDERYEKLCKQFGRSNICIAANLDVVTRADVRAVVRQINAKIAREVKRDK